MSALAHKPRTPEVEAQSDSARAQPPCAEGQAPVPDVRATFDTPGHVEVGDSVAGEAVVVNGVAFSPGELAALVDYVGNLDRLWEFAAYDLTQMKFLLATRSEDAEAWDRATGGLYTELSKANEDHFAPGNRGGPNFEASFLDAFSAAFGAAQQAQALDPCDPEHDRIMSQARLALYTAEHYLEDAFSAGHQVANTDIEDAVHACIDRTIFEKRYHEIAGRVFEQERDYISRFALVVDTPLGSIMNRIDTAPEFKSIGVAGGLLEGRGAIVDGVRKAVHERLAEGGVEVSSEAHPEPWVLPGDHDLFASRETVAALQLALSEARAAVELEAVPGVDPRTKAEGLFRRHRPVPTLDGQALVDRTLRDATANPDALVDTLVFATCETIEGVMASVVAMSDGWIVEIPGPQEGTET